MSILKQLQVYKTINTQTIWNVEKNKVILKKKRKEKNVLTKSQEEKFLILLFVMFVYISLNILRRLYKVNIFFSVCRDQYYGSDCNTSCGHCKNDDVCNNVTGHCPRGCRRQWMGNRCDGRFNGGNVIQKSFKILYLQIVSACVCYSSTIISHHHLL